MPAPPDPLADALRDRYTLQRELGRGGMAVVYLAHDLRHDRPVALKVIHPDVAAELGPERFLREIQLTARLQHPHILPIHDSGEASGRLWYAMPYFEGESLRDRLIREPQLPVEDVLHIARNVLAALGQAHKHGILHRDIKPENILLESGEAVLADFGIATAADAAGSERLTQTGVTIGTPVYMSPEQAAGARDLDARSDLYAVGCVLYEMLAGHPPFMGTTPQEILRRHVMDPVPPLRSARAEVPAPLDRAIAKALAKAPADRWSSAPQFADALRERPAAAVATRPTRRLALWAAGLAAMALAAAFVLGRRGGAPPTSTTPRLAVLPFENLGDSADAYFADGVADAVRGKLTGLPNLEVIARASSMAYRRTDKTPQEVAGELGVRYLLTGTVRWAKQAEASRVQVRPELVEIGEAGAPASRWQQPFDAALTDVFQVQADIAGQVADALHLALGRADEQQLAQRPTASLPAYDAFLKGEAAALSLTSWTPASLRAALGFYKEAVAQDSGFGLAWARIAQAHANLYVASSATPADAEAAQAALQRAERLAPTAPETYRARADYAELVRNDLAGAFAASEAGLARSPGNVDLIASSAITEARLGRFDDAVARLKRAQALDPRSYTVNHFLGIFLTFQRRWDESRQALDQALAVAPTELGAIEFRLTTDLSEGNLAAARQALADAPPGVDRAQQVALMVDHDLGWLLDRPLQDLVLSLPPAAFDDDRGSWSLTRADLHDLRGERGLARAYADTALREYEARLRVVPDDPWLEASLGMALAFRGRKAEAVAHGDRAGALLPIARDGVFGPQIQYKRVRIHLLNGEHDKALALLEPLLTVPFWLTPAWLRVDPTFAPLRGNARFERMIAGR